MPPYQPMLFALSPAAGEAPAIESQPSGVNSSLELKPYIQPFERILARAELAGLLPDAQINHPLDEPASNVFPLAASAPVEKLRRRLAYWQKVINGAPLPTSQALYEASDNLPDLTDLANLDKYLPRSRRLRYGPHDLHQYRGKFFPQLVRSLVNFSGIPAGSLVVDPFCGSGTTNCEARLVGMRTIGIDLNPLSVLIARAKTAVVELDPAVLLRETEPILYQLNNWPAESCLSSALSWSQPDIEYLNRWFAPSALSDLARLLSLVSTCTHPAVNNLLKVCLSNIVRGISWQKDTDLRVRKEVTPYQPNTAVHEFRNELQRQLAKLLPFLAIAAQERVSQFFADYEIIEGDTRQIAQAFPSYVGKCDLIITSPPYATALPYIDTDRLSLIILGLLRRKDHRSREELMIGNRETLESQRQAMWENYQARRLELPDSLCAFIDELALHHHGENVGFRRRNLPALLAKYFLDMTDAMSSAKSLLKPGSYAFYVVGNNSTTVENQRVEIATERFLWEIAAKVGWNQEKMISMELLPSRDIFRMNRGSAESILVFSVPKRVAVYSNLNHAVFSVNDPVWNFHDEDTQPHLHALHSYPARFIPQIPRKAIADYSTAGQLVLDPFCGSGTTVLESILMERPAIGVDNNAVAVLISKAKTTPYTAQDLLALQTFLSDLHYLPSGKTWRPGYDRLSFWFDEEAITDLSYIRGAIDQLPEPCRAFALAVFSSIVLRVSHQDSDTHYTKVIREYKPHSALSFYRTKLQDSLERLLQIHSLPRTLAQIHLADSRRLTFITNDSVDLIVTSPPYLNAYDYHKYHRQRLHWIDGDIVFARDKEIGKHDTFSRPRAAPDQYFSDMQACFIEWQRVLKPGARALVVVADGIVSGSPVPVADRFTEMMDELGLSLENHWLREILKTNKSFNQNSRIDKEHVLLYVKNGL